MMYYAGFIRVAESLRREIDNELSSIGLFFRVFARGKSKYSLDNKIQANPLKYVPGEKLIQDAIGIRVVLYFQEDVEIVEQLLKKKYKCIDNASAIDKPSNTEFSVSRYNLVFNLPSDYFRDVPEASAQLPIDRVFEVQIRTILSEGWHEVEHDLRYKRKDDWVGHDDLSRGLNGLVATLETAEWSMRKIFDELAYKHYKAGKWDAMLHSTLKMRTTEPLSQSVIAVFNANNDAAKKLARINRTELFTVLIQLVPRLPLTADNIVFVWNSVCLKDKKINELTPNFVLDTVRLSLQ